MFISLRKEIICTVVILVMNERLDIGQQLICASPTLLGFHSEDLTQNTVQQQQQNTTVDVGNSISFAGFQ